MDHFKNIIKAHLDNRASTDALFAKSYAKENKNIDECCNYIINVVKKPNITYYIDSQDNPAIEVKYVKVFKKRSK